MKLLIKQRVFSWTDTYDVYDENGLQKYYVKSEFFSIGHTIYVYEYNGGVVGCIKQRLLTWMPKFDIELNGQYMGTVRKELTFFKPRYVLDYLGWNIEGDIFGWNYDIKAGNRTIMHLNKELFRWGDTYVLNIYDAKDEIAGLMAAIAIDAANCSGND